MKRLFLSACLTLAALAIPAPQAKAEGCGFGFCLNLRFGISVSCNNGCGPSCPPSYGFGPCFAPAHCQGIYGASVAQAPYGYPGLPGVAHGYPSQGYPAQSYPAQAYGYQPAAPAYAPQPAAPTTQQVGYYSQAGYGNYAMPAYWYGR